MTIVRRERKDNFAIIPNIVANDERLTFAERGMLVFLLAKPHDWRVNVEHLQNVGGVGRDKVYAMLRRLIETGYIKRVTKRGKGARFASHEYIIYDDPVPDQLPLAPRVVEPLPEMPEVDEPHPENQEMVHPLPEKPLTEFPDPANQDAILITKTTNTPQSPPSLFHEQDSNDRFAKLIAEWPDDRKPNRLSKLLRQFASLGADDQNMAIEQAERWRRWMIFKKQKPMLTVYFQTRGWRLLADAPDFDNQGLFVMKPGAAQWDAWLTWISTKHGEKPKQSVEKRGYFLAPTPWPEQRDMAA